MGLKKTKQEIPEMNLKLKYSSLVSTVQGLTLR